MFSWNKTVDESELLKTIGNDITFLDTVITLFGEQSTDSLNTLKLSLVKPDWESFLRATHDLKNMGRSVSSTQLIDHAEELEQFAAERNIKLVEQKLTRTLKLLTKIFTELKDIRAKY